MIAELPVYSLAMSTLRQSCEGMDAWSTLYRQRIMLREYAIAAVIRRLCEEEAPQIVEKESTLHNSQDWFVKLTINLLHRIRSKIPIKFAASNFLPNCNNSTLVFVEPDLDFKRRGKIRPADIPARVCEYLARVLQCWFGMPIPFISQARLHLVQVLLRTCGTGILLMSHVWAIYSELPSWIFCNTCPRADNIPSNQNLQFSEAYMENFCHAVSTSQVLLHARKDFDNLQAEFGALHATTSKHVDNLLATRLKRNYLHQMVIDSSSTHPAQSAESSTSRNQPLPAPVASTSLPASVPSASSSQNPASLCNPMVLFLRDAHAFLNRTPTTVLNRAQLALDNRSDYLMPLRESAYSRMIVNDAMDLAHAKTRSGLFSLLIFRGISFNTGCFTHTPPDLRKVSFLVLCACKTFTNSKQIWFDTLESWQTHRSQMDAYFAIPANLPAQYRRNGLGTQFWCNANAYGQHLKDRTEAQAPKFWQLSQSIQWPDPAWPEFPIPFMVMHNWVHKIKKSNAELMASMGKLSIYLFVADMHAAGLVQLPSVQDMGLMINYLSAGAVSGLTLLGYLPRSFEANASTRNLVASAFEKFFQDMQQSFTAAEQQEMPWNTIVAEHCLCKLTRIQRYQDYV